MPLHPPPLDNCAADLEAVREPRNLRTGERPHSFVMADNPYRAKEHRASLKAKRLEAIRAGTTAPATLCGKFRRRPIKCVGDLGDEGVGDVFCADGTFRRAGADALQGLRRIAVEENDASIVKVTEPKAREPKPPCHPDGTPKQPEEMEPEERARYKRAVDHYEREGRAMVECIVHNTALDAEKLQPMSIEHDFAEPGVAKDRYGRDAFPVVYL